MLGPYTCVQQGLVPDVVFQCQCPWPFLQGSRLVRWQWWKMEQQANWSHHLGRLVIKYQHLAHKYGDAAFLPHAGARFTPPQTRPSTTLITPEGCARSCCWWLFSKILLTSSLRQIHIRGIPLSGPWLHWLNGWCCCLALTTEGRRRERREKRAGNRCSESQCELEAWQHRTLVKNRDTLINSEGS